MELKESAKGDTFESTRGKAMASTKERALLYCIYGLFAIYNVVLLRITL